MEFDRDKFWLLALIAYSAHVFSLMAGIFIIDKLNLDETIFHFTSDLKKTIVCSLLELIMPLLILYTLPLIINTGIAMGIFYLLAFWFFTKITYLKITMSEIAVLVLVNGVGITLIGWPLIKHFNIIIME